MRKKVLDIVTLEVLRYRFAETQRAMMHTLFHTGYSTILRDGKDGSCGITDEVGDFIGGEGFALHSIPYTYTVKAVLNTYGKDINDGDSFIANDPYLSGALHAPDMTAATPVFYKGELIAFCVSIAHKPDIGGLVPGSSSAQAREKYHEGILIPAVRYYDKGNLIREVEAILQNNSRTPELVKGDVHGQVGATRVGCQMMKGLCDEYGVDTVKDSFRELVKFSEKRVKSILKELPDGEFESENFLDNDGAELDKPVKFHVKVIKKGEDVIFDFSGSDSQTVGPVNLRPQVVESASIMALVSFLDCTIPFNEGIRRAIQFVLPEGKVVNPRSPAPCNHYVPSAHLVYNCLQNALSKFDPKRAVAESGIGIGAVAFGYPSTRTGKTYVQYEIIFTALGGNNLNDGQSIIFAMICFSPSQPIEILETEFPVKVREVAVRKDSGGPGRRRGGLGYVREYEVLEGCIFTARLAHHKYISKGIFGGKSPLPNRLILNPGTKEERELPPMVTVKLAPGEVIRIEQSGGAGYGDPLERDRELVISDLLNGYISIDAAKTEYGQNITDEELVRL